MTVVPVEQSTGTMTVVPVEQSTGTTPRVSRRSLEPPNGQSSRMASKSSRQSEVTDASLEVLDKGGLLTPRKLASFDMYKNAPGCVPSSEFSEAVSILVPLSGRSSLQDEDLAFQLRPAWVLNDDSRVSMTRSARRTMGKAEMDEFKQQRLKQWSMNVQRSGGGDKTKRTYLPLHPQSSTRLSWDLLAVVLLGYDFVVMPLSAFGLPTNDFFLAMDQVILGYWTFDMVMSCSTGCYVDGKVSLKWRNICMNYLKTWFAFDVIILLPEWLQVWAGNDRTSSAGGILRTTRGARAMRFLRYIRLLRLVKADKLLKDLKARINNTTLLLCLTIARLIFGVVMLCHVLASAWYFMGETSSDGWVYNEGIESRSLLDKYLFTFQWSLARLHPSSFGKNDSLQSFPDRIFAIVVSMLALGGGGYFVSCITNAMAQLQTLRHARTRKMYVIREYVRSNNISLYLAMRIKNYVEKTMNQKLQVIYAKEIAEFLPTSLLMDLRFEAWSPVVSAHSFFMKLTTTHPRLVWCLCKQSLAEMAVLPGDTVFTTSDTCDKMFFVSVGDMTYALGRIMGMSSDTMLVDQRVTCGQWLSEPVLWTSWEHKGELVGQSESTVLSLEAEGLIELAKGHAQGARDIGFYARRFVSALNERPEEHTDLLPACFLDDLISEISQD
eukprot:TRINITY_DN6926_c0_g2_i2.p1 TRINITY_DN6926_c0_g2~~TRINITY_DN6926_c0_g2_i2.p1  ORF type:complete len:665 (-),score=110.29 TRINITY_DN6926_c0_g2_i2:200-2194(-)